MLYYFLLPLLSILLIILQSTLSDVILSGRLVLELSLIVVIFAGFHLDIIRGAVLAFMLGLIFDCVSGPVLGLFTFIYVVIFLFSFFASERLATEKMSTVVLFSFFCALLKDFMVILFYSLAFRMDMTKIHLVFLPQALMVSLFAPLFFYLLRRLEVFFYGEEA